MFEFENVTKSYGETVVLESMSLIFQTNQTTAIIGRSGCGKSTVLRLMVGLLQPDGGCIRFDGEAINNNNLITIRRRVGYIIQDGGLFPHLTGFENVALLASHLSWPKKKIEDRVDELLQLTRLTSEQLLRYPAQMSGGQRQRVSIIRALMLDPAVMLLDEPFAALDPIVRYELQEDLAAIFNQLHKTVIIVTHDMAEAAFFAKRLVMMDVGKIIQTGSLTEFINHPASELVSTFMTCQRSLPARSDGISFR